MTGLKEIVTHSMNLDPAYIANWGAFEAARELYANGMDADREGCIVGGGIGEYSVYTRTSPSLENVLCIGNGTKDKESDDIGQFGEGIKLAALAACRTEGAELVVDTEFGRVTYSLIQPPHYTIKVLHAHVDENVKQDKGCHVRLLYPDVDIATLGKFLPREALVGKRLKRNNNVLLEPTPEAMIYVKGIWVAKLDQDSFYDWNLLDAGINRDRSIIDDYQMRYEIGRLLTNNVEEYKELWEHIFCAPKCLEAKAIDSVNYIGGPDKKKIAAIFLETHGANAVIAHEDPRINERARNAGMKTISCNEDLRDHIGLKGADGIPHAEQFMPKLVDLKGIPLTDEWQEKLTEVNRVMELLGGHVRLNVFDGALYPGYEQIEAQASWDSAQQMGTVWINKPIMEGDRVKLLAAAFHELAHISSNMSDDQTLMFGWAQSNLGGQLAAAWLDETKE